MARKEEGEMIVGLDIGTSKVVAIVAEINPTASDKEMPLRIIGMGSCPARGMNRGVVVNIESTVEAIQRAVNAAELMANCQIHSVYAGIAGSHIKSSNSTGTAVKIKDSEVTQDDVERVLDGAKAMPLPAEHKLLHALVQEYTIDQQPGIREPIGMSGMRLEADVHLVTGAVSAVQNITKCIERCGLEVNGIVLEQVASSHAVLSEDEKELGVCMVDIGGGTTDIAVFIDGALKHTAVIPIAGDQVTNDITTVLRTPKQAAEEIKLKYACALAAMVREDEEIEVPSVGERAPRQMSLQTLASAMECRYAELFELVKAELEHHGFAELISAGVVLTGGSSKMRGAVELAEDIFGLPVRLGVPQHVGGLLEVVRNPIHATGVGLLLYGYQEQMADAVSGRTRNKNWLSVMKSWFQGNF